MVATAAPECSKSCQHTAGLVVRYTGPVFDMYVLQRRNQTY
jgi:hypothetical protein